MPTFDRKQYNADRKARARARQTTEGLYYLPGETHNKTLAEFVEWFRGLDNKGKSGTGTDYGGARAGDIRNSVEIIMRTIMGMDWATGDDVLLVAANQAETCHKCIAGEKPDPALDLGRRRLACDRSPRLTSTEPDEAELALAELIHNGA
jgi:hypothetical protein